MSEPTPLTDEFFDGELDKCPAAEFCRTLERRIPKTDPTPTTEREAHKSYQQRIEFLESKFDDERAKVKTLRGHLFDAVEILTKEFDYSPDDNDQWNAMRAATEDQP